MEVNKISKKTGSMKSLICSKNSINFALALFVVVSITIGLSSCDNANAQGGISNNNATVRWEYKLVNISTGTDFDGTFSTATAAFNELGKEGWEYVGFSEIGNGYSSGHIFKRRLP